MSSEHPNADLVLQALRAIERGDVQMFWETQAEDVTASVLGQGDLAGEFSGRESRDWIPCQIYGKLALMEPSLRPNTKGIVVIDVLANDEYAVLLYEVTGNDPDRRLRGVAIFTIANAKITDIQHFDPLAAAGGLKALR